MDVAPTLGLLWLTCTSSNIRDAFMYSIVLQGFVLAITYISLFLTCLAMMTLNTMVISKSKNTPIDIKLETSGTRMPVDGLFMISEPVVIMEF